MNVVVVGAGIAGLTAAWDLVRDQCDVTVFESERRPGGVVVTASGDGFLAEAGPDGFLAGEPELPALAADVGIADHLIAQRARGASQWMGDELVPIEEGQAAALLGIETRGVDVGTGFRSFAGGMAEPVAALAARLTRCLQYAQGVTGMTRAGSRWRVALGGGSTSEADAVVLALPAYACGRLLEAAGIPGARALAEVVYVPSTTVSLGYRSAQLRAPLAGAGFVVARDAEERVGLRACTFASEKFAGRAPAGHVLLRAFLTPGAGDATVRAHAALAAILKIEGAVNTVGQGPKLRWPCGG